MFSIGTTYVRRLSILSCFMIGEIYKLDLLLGPEACIHKTEMRVYYKPVLDFPKAIDYGRSIYAKWRNIFYSFNVDTIIISFAFHVLDICYVLLSISEVV